MQIQQSLIHVELLKDWVLLQGIPSHSVSIDLNED